jgi:putative membrane protein
LRFGAVSGNRPLLAILAVSAAAVALLLWLVYGGARPAVQPAWVAGLPHLNAGLNASTTLLMLAGVLNIRRGRRDTHRRFMLAALATSALFLVSYLAYHRFHGDTPYPLHDWTRPLYFFILITHIALSAVVLPMLLTTVWFAGLGVFERHRRLARWTFPLWLYISVSGVLVYLFLRPYY